MPSSRQHMPHDRRLDSTMALFANPYGFISGQCRELKSDTFQARILLGPTICMTGPQAAAVFYDTQRFQRAGAAPEPLQATLFGKRAVQGLDGPTHLARKALFMNTLGPDAVAALAEQVSQQWDITAAQWRVGASIPLYEAAHDVLTRAVCRWAGVPLPEQEVVERTRDVVALFDDAARGLRSHLHARLARRRLEIWLTDLIDRVRHDDYSPPDGSALEAVSRHQDVTGVLLESRVAAVELLNLIRPTVAVSVFIAFAAHAMQANPAVRAPLRDGDSAYVHDFLQEVRRFYPFFPAVMAKVKEDFVWNGYLFPKGRRALLDLYGINHDPRVWKAPDQFDPQRFNEREPTPFDFIPQGGSDARTNHRCPGENVAMALMKVSVDFLVNRLSHQWQDEDAGIDTKRLPALPRQAMILTVTRDYA